MMLFKKTMQPSIFLKALQCDFLPIDLMKRAKKGKFYELNEYIDTKGICLKMVRSANRCNK